MMRLDTTSMKVQTLDGELLHEVPFVAPMVLSAQLAALTDTRPLPENERITRIKRAGEIFATEVLEGTGAEDYALNTARTSGIPVTVVRDSTSRLRAHTNVIDQVIGYSTALGNDTAEVRRVRRGNLVGAHATGIHPGSASTFLEALALGFRVSVRLNRREPLTSLRLMSALRRAGFDDGQVLVTAQEQGAAERQFAAADFVYGGDEVIRANSTSPKVLPQTSSRSAVLVGQNADTEQAIQTSIESIVGHGGVSCTNSRLIAVHGNARRFAEALAERLGEIPIVPSTEESAILPIIPPSTADAISKYLASVTKSLEELSTSSAGTTGEAGATCFTPKVYYSESSNVRPLDVPVPVVTVIPWDSCEVPDAVLPALQLTAIGLEDQALNDLRDDPRVGNLAVGTVPTTAVEPGGPHDGYLADYLTRAKLIQRSVDG